MSTKNKMSSEAWAEFKKKKVRKTEYIPVRMGKPNTRKDRRKKEREEKKNARV